MLNFSLVNKEQKGDNDVGLILTDDRPDDRLIEVKKLVRRLTANSDRMMTVLRWHFIRFLLDRYPGKNWLFYPKKIHRWAICKKIPQIANQQICRLNCFRFADLPQMWLVAVLRFADDLFLLFADLRTQLFFATLKLPEIRVFAT
jgi:hypothetical protein